MIPRKSYSCQYKLRVLDYAASTSNTAACTLFNICPSMISRWKSKRHDIERSKKTCKRVGHSGRPISFPQTEHILHRWVVDEREQLFPVSLADIREKMNELTHNQFKASSGWLYGFIKRFGLSLRKITGNTKMDTPIDLYTRMNSFHAFLDKMKTRHDIGQIINMDQTPVWLNIGSTGRTVDKKGKKNISALTPPGNPREKLSVILACDEAGNKLAPAVIMKSGKAKARIRLVNGVLVFNNPKTSMANSNIMSQWIKIMIPKEDNLQKKLLIMDSFRGHLTEQIKQTCDDNGIIRAIIPGGLTGSCQPLDLTVNRSFKCKLRDYYKRHGLRQSRASTSTQGSFNLDVFTKGVIYAWGRVKRVVIKNGFDKMYHNLN